MTYKNYWERYYSKHKTPTSPSPFAEFIIKHHLRGSGILVELGCGNGRDAIYIGNKTDLDIIALDQCEDEIDFLKKNYGNDKLKFESGDFTNYTPQKAINYVYSRWTMHSINEQEEDNTLNWVSQSLLKGGVFFIEARSIKDELYGKGKELGNNAFLTDHYRRFMIIEDFISKLKNNGFKIKYQVESQGLAVYKEDDPFIIRIIAQKL